MMQWTVLYKKEMLEMWRGYKWMWLPLVFILLGAMQPITTYFMPQILEAAGGLPEGATIEIPTPTGGEMMAAVIDQYGTLGVLLLALAGMGIMAGEKQSRSISLIMVRPVPHASFMTAKWAAFATIGLVSFVIGSLSGWYYTELLIGDVSISSVIEALSVYGLWLLFVMTVTILMSTLLKGNSAIAFVSILIIVVVSVTTSLLSKWMMWSPARLTGHAAQILANGEAGKYFAISLIVATIAIVGMLIVAIASFKRQELAD